MPKCVLGSIILEGQFPHLRLLVAKLLTTANLKYTVLLWLGGNHFHFLPHGATRQCSSSYITDRVYCLGCLGCLIFPKI